MNQKLEKYLEDRLNSLGRLVKNLGESVQAQVLLGCETEHHLKGKIYLAESILFLPGKKIVAKSSSNTIFNAIDEMKQELHLAIKEYKERLIERKRKK